jgi:hypothetical protein
VGWWLFSRLSRGADDDGSSPAQLLPCPAAQVVVVPRNPKLGPSDHMPRRGIQNEQNAVTTSSTPTMKNDHCRTGLVIYPIFSFLHCTKKGSRRNIFGF